MLGLTHHSRRDPTECEKGRAEVLGTLSARAHRECNVQCGECDCGRQAFRVGKPVVTLRSAWYTKGHDTRLLLYTALAPYPVQCTHVHLRNRTS